MNLKSLLATLGLGPAPQPTLLEVLDAELNAARLQLLTAQAQAEYHSTMAEMLAVRVERLILQSQNVHEMHRVRVGYYDDEGLGPEDTPLPLQAAPRPH